MTAIKEEAGHPIQDGDWVGFPSQQPMNRGMVTSIKPIMQRGPYQGGTHVTIRHEVDYLIPPGHTLCPVMLVVPSDDEKKKTEAFKKGTEAVSSFLTMP